MEAATIQDQPMDPEAMQARIDQLEAGAIIFSGHVEKLSCNAPLAVDILNSYCSSFL